MGLETELVGALKGITQSLSLKELKRRRVESVRVVTRAGLAAILEELKGKPRPEAGSGASPDARRIARLLEEVEKLGQAKLSLEHEKGLVEAERARLAAELARVSEAVGQESGKKLAPEELKGLVDELVRLREEKRLVEASLDQTQKQSLARLEQETGRVRALTEELENLKRTALTRGETTTRLEEERDRLARERARIEEERSRYLEERDQYRAERDQCRAERDQFRQERDKFLEEREALRAQRDQFREQRDQFREQRQQLHEENAALARERARLEERLQREQEKAAALEKELEALKTPPAEEPAKPEAEKPAEGGAAPARDTRRAVSGFGFGFGPVPGRPRSR